MSATRYQQLCASRANEIFKHKALTVGVGAKRLAGEQGRWNGQGLMSAVADMDFERAEAGVSELFKTGEGNRRHKEQNEVEVQSALVSFVVDATILSDLPKKVSELDS